MDKIDPHDFTIPKGTVEIWAEWDKLVESFMKNKSLPVDFRVDAFRVIRKYTVEPFDFKDIFR